MFSNPIPKTDSNAGSKMNFVSIARKEKIYPIIDLPLEFHTRISSRTKQKPTEAKLESIPRGERERIYLLSLNCRKIWAFVSRTGKKIV